MFIKKRLMQQKRTVFSLTIKHYITDRHCEHSCDNLTPDKHFHAKFRNDMEYKEGNASANYFTVKNFCECVVKDEVKKELQELIDIPIIEVKVHRIYEGSLIIVFSVLFNIYQFVGGISGFRDSLKLIEHTVERHLKKRLKEEFITEGDFEVDVHTENDRNYDYMLNDVFHLGWKGRGFFRVPNNSYCHTVRDGLFWYLLISNIILLILIFALVGKAVVKMYW